MTSSDGGSWGPPEEPTPEEPRPEESAFGESPAGELPPRTDEADPGPAAPARVIAAGHLHPGMLFLRVLDGLRQAVLPVALGLISGQPWLWIAAGVFFVFALIYALARYLTFEYRLTEEELVTTEGILHRQERRIPVNRIQDLGFESTLIRRIFGLVVVSVETASSQGSEAKLDSLSRRHAEQLREALYLTRSSGSAETPEAPPQERLLWRATGAELFLLGLTNNRIGVIFAALFGIYELSIEFGFGESVGGAVTGWIASLSPGLAAAVVLAVVFVALIGGWLVSIAASFLMFYDFRLSVREEVFQRRYGLITTRSASLPLRKVQRVLLEQSLLRRLLKMSVVRADSAGSGMDPTEETRGGRDIVVPLAELKHAEALASLLLPGLDLPVLAWHRVSPRVVMRIFLQGVILAALALGIGFPILGWFALLALLILPIAWAFGALSYHNLGYADGGDYFGLRWGILGRYRSVLPLRKVQGVVFRASPVDRMLGLASLTVYVAGGSPTSLRHLTRSDALALQDRLARVAAQSRFVW